MHRVLVASCMSLVALANTVNAAEGFEWEQSEAEELSPGDILHGDRGPQTYNWNPRNVGRDISRALEHAGTGISEEMKALSESVSHLDPAAALVELANKSAAQYHSEHGTNGNFEDCSIVVIGALAAIGSYGGPWTAALGGAAGAAGARLACRAWYP